MKVLDLFSGIGGFSLGLERAGMETVAFCEVDETCQRVLEKHWPEIPIWDDVKSLNKNALSAIGIDQIDVICGGFPCQDISVAGKGKGLKGERSGLWFEYKRLIGDLRPRYAIIENVANLRSRGLTTVLQDLRALGYNVEWHIISACSIGAVHRRERIWIIAYADGTQRPRDGSPERIKKELSRVGNDGSERIATDADGDELRERTKRSERRRNDLQAKRKAVFGDDGTKGPSPYANHFRLGIAFASSEEKQKWRTKTAARFSHLREEIGETKPSICRSDDGLSKRSYEDKSGNVGMELHRIEVLKRLKESGRLEVDFETGRIFSLTKGQKTLLKGADLNGYTIHKLYFEGEKHAFRAHQIVMAFDGQFSTKGKVIDHINRNRKDNRLCNLRMTDAKGNRANQDREEKPSFEEKLEIYDIYKNSKISIRNLADLVGLSKSRIGQIIKEMESDKPRRERVKQLGNAVVPQIPQIIGEAILNFEERRK